MERVVHRASNHAEARAWDIEQHVSMTPEERLRAARVLKDRAYPRDSKDVRECHPKGATGRPKDLDDLSYLTRERGSGT